MILSYIGPVGVTPAVAVAVDGGTPTTLPGSSTVAGTAVNGDFARYTSTISASGSEAFVTVDFGGGYAPISCTVELNPVQQGDVAAIRSKVDSTLDAAVSSRLVSGNVTVGGYAAGKSPAEALASYDPPTRDEAASDRDAVAAVVTAVKSVVDVNLDAKVSSRVSAGPGGVLRRIYVRDVAGSALGGVQVWLTADAAGNSVLGGSFTTDDAGSVLVMVDVGATYYVWCDSSAADFMNPMEWTVA